MRKAVAAAANLSTCKVIFMGNFFELFSLPVSFSINLADLEKKYVALQMQYHPDRFVGKADKERIDAASKSADVNNGYNILKSPVKRAEHILNLKEISVGDQREAVKPSQSLLVEMLEIREVLYESKNPKEIENLGIKAEKDYESTLKNLEKIFAENNFAKAAEETIRLKYLSKFLEEIKTVKARLVA